jgi:hypothetical protein
MRVLAVDDPEPGWQIESRLIWHLVGWSEVLLSHLEECIFFLLVWLWLST